MHKTFEIVCPLGARDALDRVERLLDHEGVTFEARERSIASTHTPIAVLGIQPRLYTNKNWVGINPFAFISGLDVSAEAVEAAITKITVRINRRRSLLIFLSWVVCGSLAARGMPERAGAISLVGLSIAAWFGVVSYLGCYLVRKEIDVELRV